jgi:hypothetical protein
MATPLKVLKDFFGYLPGQDLKGFAAELKTLSNEEKAELATLAAQALGVELDNPAPAKA